MMQRFLKEFIGFEKPDLIVCGVLGLFSAFLMLILPLGVQSLVNSIAFTGLLQPIAVLSGIVFVILVNAYAANALQSYAVERLQRRIYARAVVGVIASGPEMDKAELGAELNPMLTKLSRFLEISVIQKNLAFFVVEGLTLILQLLTGVLLLSFYHVALLLFGLGLLGSVVLVIWIFFKRALLTAEKESSAKYQFVDSLLKDGGRQNADGGVEVDAAIQAYEYLTSRGLHYRYLFTQTVLLYCIAVFAVTSLLGLGGYLVVDGSLSLGQLVAAELVVGAISVSLSKLPKQLEAFYDLSASLGKLSQIYRSGREASLDSTFKKFHIEPVMAFGGARRLGWVVLGVLSLLLISILLLPWQQTSMGTGRVVALDPAERPQTLHATIEGRVASWKVREGDLIEKDQVLVELVDLDPLTIERLERQRETIHRQLRSIEVSRDTATKNLSRQMLLEKDGIVATRTLELARHDLAIVTKEEATIYERLAEIDMRIARQRAQTVVAPVAGFVSQVHRGQGGDIVKMGDPLVTLVPRAPTRVAEIWINGNDAPLVYAGRKARLQFEGWPAVQFSGFPKLALGTFEARVRMVDWADNGKGQFRVLLEEVEPNSWPNAILLRQGVRVISWVLLERVRVGYEIWRNINGFPPVRTPVE